MSGWYEQARARLEHGYGQVKGQKESAMKGAVRDALLEFCRQNEEFAQAVVQGGRVEECIKSVLKGAGNSLSDLEAYKRAAAFFFPGCVVTMKLAIAMSEHDAAQADTTANRPVLLDLTDFL